MKMKKISWLWIKNHPEKNTLPVPTLLTPSTRLGYIYTHTNIHWVIKIHSLWWFFISSWSHLEVWTNGNFPDSVQVKAAGVLEGYLTHELIYMSFLNTLEDYCQGRDEYCDKLRNYLVANTKWINKMSKKLRKTSPFWHQVFFIWYYLKRINFEELFALGRVVLRANGRTGCGLETSSNEYRPLNGQLWFLVSH